FSPALALPAALVMIEEHVLDDPKHPGEQRRLVAKAGERTIDLDERLLGQIGGLVRVAREGAREAEDLALIDADQPLEGRGVAMLRLLDEASLVGAARISAGRLP